MAGSLLSFHYVRRAKLNESIFLEFLGLDRKQRKGSKRNCARMFRRHSAHVCHARSRNID